MENLGLLVFNLSSRDPSLEPDQSHSFIEPSLAEIFPGLKSYGIPQDIEHFEKALYHLKDERS